VSLGNWSSLTSGRGAIGSETTMPITPA